MKALSDGWSNSACVSSMSAAATTLRSSTWSPMRTADARVLARSGRTRRTAGGRCRSRSRRRRRPRSASAGWSCVLRTAGERVPGRSGRRGARSTEQEPNEVNQRRAPTRSRSARPASGGAVALLEERRPPRRREPPSKARRVATRTLRKPWCSKPPSAVVAYGAVQAGGALERRLPVERRVDPARRAWPRSGTRSWLDVPPVRSFSRCSAAATSSAAASQPAVGRRRGSRRRPARRRRACRRRGRVDGGDHPAGVAGRVVGVAQRDLEPGDREAEPARPAPSGAGDLPGAAGDDDRERRAPEPRTQRDVGVA